MPFWRKHFSSKHLDSGDLAEGQKAAIRIVGIGDSDLEDTDGAKKMLIHFKPGEAFAKTCKKTTWVCSLTVGHQLAAMFGSDDAAWIGKVIVVYAAPIRDGEAVRVYGSPQIDHPVECKVRDFGGKKTWRMVPTASKPAPTTAPTAAELAAADEGMTP